jgi:hypothetical protein
MKIHDKNIQLKNKKYLAAYLSKSVYATMALEDQEVPMKKVEELVYHILNEKELIGNQFFTD